MSQNSISRLTTKYRLDRFALCTLLLYLVVFFPHSPAQAKVLVPLHISKGTNLIHIARDYCYDGWDWVEIARLNNLQAPYRVFANSTLMVPLDLLRAEKLSATVAAIHGQAFFVEENKPPVALKKGDSIWPGQIIETGSDGHVHLIFPDKKYSRIEPDTRLTLTYLIRLEDKSLKAEFKLTKGRIVHAIDQKLKLNETFRTRTPVSITGVRGTEFRLKMTDSETNVIETLRGKVTVDAAGTLVQVASGEASRVRTGEPPEAPRPLPDPPAIPQLEPVYRTLPVVLPAPQHPNAVRIRLRVTTDEAGQKTIFERFVDTGGKFAFMTPGDGVFYAFLTAFDAEGFESPAIGPLSITVRTIPAAPVISSPKTGLTTFVDTVQVDWLKSEQAVGFALQLATEPTFADPISDLQMTEPLWVTPSLVPGEYYFRVQALAADGFRSLFSTPLKWKVAEQPTLGTMETSAADGVHLQWSAMKEKGTYDLQIAGDMQFEQLVASVERLENAEYAVTDYMTPGDYYVRIRGVLEDGQQSPWAPAQVLKVEPEPLGLDHVLMILGIIGCILL